MKEKYGLIVEELIVAMLNNNVMISCFPNV